MTLLDRGLGAALAAAATTAIVWASTAAMTTQGAEAVLRLAWSARPQRLETCRQPGEGELAGLPAHMRQQIVCEGSTAQYRLTVRYGGTLLVDRIVRGGGLRRDRRLYVFHEIAVPAGDGLVEVRFTRLDAGGPSVGGDENDAAAEREGAAGRWPHGDTVPPRLAFDQALTFSPRQVILVTYDQERRALVAVRH